MYCAIYRCGKLRGRSLKFGRASADSISPDITSTNAIYAKDSSVNVAGRDQISIMNIYKVDPSVGPTNLPTSTEIYQWLSAVIISTNYYGALKVRLEDTGSWFIDGARFARWKATADDFVWICGPRMYSHHLRIIINSKLVW